MMNFCLEMPLRFLDLIIKILKNALLHSIFQKINKLNKTKKDCKIFVKKYRIFNTNNQAWKLKPHEKIP